MTAPLYQRDPEAWRAYLAEGNAAQARKRVSADALIRDQAGRILLVDPGSKPGWDLPGGMAEANESPDDCPQRQVREELALDLQVGPVPVVDWVPPHGSWDDLLAFVFDGGVLTAERIAAIRLPGEWWRDVAALQAAASRRAAEASDEDRPGWRAPQ